MSRLSIAIALTALCLATAATGGEIYKHVDEDGTITYRDRPTGEAGEQVLARTYRRTDNAAVQAEIQRRQEYVASLEKEREAEEERETEQAQAALDAEERAARCEQSRTRLESYLRSRRLYRENEDGEREYLDDSEALAARQKVEELVAEYCS